jgi:hypothetical protein
MYTVAVHSCNTHSCQPYAPQYPSQYILHACGLTNCHTDALPACSLPACLPATRYTVTHTGQILQASAQHWEQLLLGTLLIGLGIAPLLHSTWVECAEIAPPQWRAGFLACSAVGRSFGLWASLVCMSAVDMSQMAHGWRVVVALGGYKVGLYMWACLVCMLYKGLQSEHVCC